MIENTSVTEVSNILLDNTTVNRILDIIEIHTLMKVSRLFMFVHGLHGYSLSQLCNNSSDLDNIIQALSSNLGNNNLFNNMKLFEKGIAINTLQSSIDIGMNAYYELDFQARHVRIPIRGVSTIDSINLEIGKAYVIDNTRNFSFNASADTIHLVFNYLDNGKQMPWELWYPHKVLT